MIISFRSKVSILFFPIILLFIVQVSGQETIDLKKDDFIFRYKKNTKKTEAVKKYDESFLAPGFYKTKEKDIVSSFEVGDSGKLVGRFKTYNNQTLNSEKLWNDGIEIRENIYLSNRKSLVYFDSTVNVLLYDSITNSWKSQKKIMHIQQDFPSAKNETRILIMKGGSDSYAAYFFENNRLVRERIPSYYDKRFDTDGNVTLLIQYNWKLKQIETTRFKEGKVLSNETLKNKNIIWDKKGFVIEPDNEEIGKESVTNYLYPSGIVKRRIVFKNLMRTEIDYDVKGKIKSQNTYKIVLDSEKVQGIAPVNAN